MTPADLLSALHCPKSSKLAWKRTVDRNPPRKRSDVDPTESVILSQLYPRQCAI